jgi:predicted enzyme related to lactoylglutathione lyase
MEMVDCQGRFAWYELLTTDMAAARVFYGNVLGWETQNASTPDLVYNLFTVGQTPLGGLMELPKEARQMGASPRWVGYVGVDDVDALMRRGIELGGTEALAAADMQGVGRVGYLLDPDNNVFGMISAVMSDGTTGMGGGA